MKKKKKKNVSNYVIKLKQQAFVRDPVIGSIINKRVDIVNKVFTEAYMLFNLYIIYNLKNNIQIEFNATTIERCTLLVLNKTESFRKKDNEVTKLIDFYNNFYLKLGTNKLNNYQDKTINGQANSNYIKSITSPISYLSRQLITNIINHISIHFYKYQKKYMKSIVSKTFSKLKLKKNVM